MSETDENKKAAKKATKKATTKPSAPKKPVAKKPVAKKTTVKTEAKKPAAKKTNAKKPAPKPDTQKAAPDQPTPPNHPNDVMFDFLKALDDGSVLVEELLEAGFEMAKDIFEDLQDTADTLKNEACAKYVRAKIYGKTYYKEGKFFLKDKVRDASGWTSEHPALAAALVSAATSIALALISRRK